MYKPTTKRALAVLGTASDVGKSLITTALGRLLSDHGLRVAPFKAQNMALQAGVTVEGGEMGRAQMLQAAACRVEPHVDMNPVLLKPIDVTGAQLVVLGQVAGMTRASDYFRDTRPLAEVTRQALLRLSRRHEVIVIEGAGSPVEINLMDRDFVNLAPARLLGAAIILVTDIDRGGVFAQVKGTLDLLPAQDRARVIGVVVNRFRGDLGLFDDGITQLETLTGVPVLAVVPWIRHGLDEEDRPPEFPIDAPVQPGRLNVGVLLHPHVANTEDLAPLLAEPDVAVSWLTRPQAVAGRDLLILPGTKATVADLIHHTRSEITDAIRAAAATGTWLLGICGGYQMLGETLLDPNGTEGGPPVWPGLGLLSVQTVFKANKTLAVQAWQSAWPQSGLPLSGYEIHHGHTHGTGHPLVAGTGPEVGAVRDDERVRIVGGYLHGLLKSDGWRAAFLARVRQSRGLPAVAATQFDPLDARIQSFADHFRASLRPGAWRALLAAAGVPYAEG